MSDAMWYYAVDGTRNGPVSNADLCALFAQSTLPIDTPVWAPGMADWVAAAAIEEFRGVWGKGFVPPSGRPAPAPSIGRPTLAPVVADPFGPSNSGFLGRPSLHGTMGDRGGTGNGLNDKRWEGLPQVRPWIRFWARGLDETIIVAAAVYLFATAWPEGLFYFPYVLVGSLILNPIQMTMFGTTLGKFVFGISVETEHGEPPSLGQAAAREFSVLLRGCGLNFFVAPLITKAMAFRRLVSEGATTWDRAQGLVVRHRAVGPLRWTAWLALSLLFGIYIFAAAGDLKATTIAQGESFTGGVRRVRAAAASTEPGATTPATQPVKKPRPKPKLLTLPGDAPPAETVLVKPKNPAATTRPAKSPNRPAPKVIFKPVPAKES